jgi:hypothetical protein
MIVKKCKIHGDLTEGQVRKEKNNQMKLGFQYRCLECRRDKDRIYKLNNPDKHRASANRKRNEDRALYREGLSDIEPRSNILAREDRKNNPEKHLKWTSDYRKRTGQFRNTREVCRRLHTTPELYYEMLKQQENKCAICNEEETRKSRTDGKICALAIDHCHNTGKIRGLLCHGCNTGLGKFKDDINILLKAIQYLKQHEHIKDDSTGAIHE